MVEGSEGAEASRLHGTAGDEDERTVIDFAELPEEEPGESGELR
jgi:hypothetical protein